MTLNQETLVNLTADIAAAHVGHNPIAVDDVAPMIQSIYDALEALINPVAEPAPEKPKGAVSIRASIKSDHLISMIDGKPYKMLKGHLRRNGYTPDSYRAAFNLPSNYPMVAPEYAERRSALSKTIGLGRKPKAPEATTVSKKPRPKKEAIPKAQGQDVAAS